MIRTLVPQLPAQWDHYYHTRYLTLRAPLGFPPGRYEDPTDGEAWHLLAWDDTTHAPAGVVRGQLLVNPTEAQIRYMGVLDAYKGAGVGRQLLQDMEAFLTEQGAHTVGLNARDYAVPFYEKCGYQVSHPTGLLIADIPHYWMHKALK